jgi:hypothetical protein
MVKEELKKLLRDKINGDIGIVGTNAKVYGEYFQNKLIF